MSAVFPLGASSLAEWGLLQCAPFLSSSFFRYNVSSWLEVAVWPQGRGVRPVPEGHSHFLFQQIDEKDVSQKKKVFFSPGLFEGQNILPFSAAAFDAVFLNFTLSCYPGQAGLLLLDALRIAARVFVLDFRMPERNLDLLAQGPLRLLLKMLGTAYYQKVRVFAEKGYLHGLVQGAELFVHNEKSLAAGALLVAEIQKKRA